MPWAASRALPNRSLILCFRKRKGKSWTSLSIVARQSKRVPHRFCRNPFFALQLLRSLQDGGFLVYNQSKRSWDWDEEHISSMDITGNLLYLLSSRMSGLSDNSQLTLKVAG